MSDQLKKEESTQQLPQKKIFAEARGKYSMLDGVKMFAFEFPANSTLAENYAALTFVRDEIWKAMEAQKKAEEAKKEPAVKPDQVEAPNETK